MKKMHITIIILVLIILGAISYFISYPNNSLRKWMNYRFIKRGGIIDWEPPSNVQNENLYSCGDRYFRIENNNLFYGVNGSESILSSEVDQRKKTITLYVAPVYPLWMRQCKNFKNKTIQDTYKMINHPPENRT